jgi:hypothetical protein
MAWGGAEEQAAERRKGNFLAKNWQDEAEKVLERTVSTTIQFKMMFALNSIALDGTLLEYQKTNRADHSH